VAPFTNATDFKGWVVGFYGEQSRALAGVASMIADAQAAKWQARYGRDPTDQQRASRWLVSTVYFAKSQSTYLKFRVAGEQGAYGHCHEGDQAQLERAGRADKNPDHV
jgi:hypothetical protein